MNPCSSADVAASPGCRTPATGTAPEGRQGAPEGRVAAPEGRVAAPERRVAAPEGVVVAAVRPRTPAAAAGFVHGDRVVRVNGEPIRDVIDFQFHAGEERLELIVEREDGRWHPLALTRRGPDLGLEFVPPRPGEIATCANKCVFCFIHQLPRGLRRSLYVKDDDYRLSFLHGNYITLSDLDEAAMDRIVEQRLSPLYVSVHATDPELRHRLLGRPRHSAEILPRMERLAKAGVRMHAQIVLCPELNDGEHLRRTVSDLAPLHPRVATVAIVPVGLTRHRERLPALRVLRADEARDLVETVEQWQAEYRRTLGSRVVFLADEVYLLAGREVPAGPAYEGFPVIEDGIGLVRRFEDGVARALARRRRIEPRRVTVVTGAMYGPRMAALAGRLDPSRTRVRVAMVTNELFGHGIGVAGLLSGRDIQRHLAALGDLGDEVLVPAVTVRDVDGVFLDDVTPADVGRDLGVPVRVVDPTGAALVRALVAA
jgi:putative radical SAM enzyme (TIGR03279 family)